MMKAVMELQGCSVIVRTDSNQRLKVLDEVSLEVRPGEFVALVGESGSGKTLTTRLMMGLLDSSCEHIEGSVLFDGQTVSSPGHPGHPPLGRKVGAVFQDPTTALNPVMTVRAHLAEVLNEHQALSRSEVESRSVELLGQVGIAEPALRMAQYPHQLSGGLCQRVMIALAIANRPALLIADEPTTALDATVQARILELIASIRRDLGTAVLMVSHDLSVVKAVADRVLVMKSGRIVEEGPLERVMKQPEHPYTRLLIDSSPSMYDEAGVSATSVGGPVLEAKDLHKTYRVGNRWGRRGEVEALAGVSFALHAGEAVGIVGESGSGKSTLAKLLLGLEQPTVGNVVVDDVDIAADGKKSLSKARTVVQTVFQNPHSSLDPRMTALQSIAEPLRVQKRDPDEWSDEISRLCGLVGFEETRLESYPHQLSGGQCQRVAIARALASRPRALILDEPTSALDVTIQAQIVDLLRDLQASLGLGYVFITHNLAIVRKAVDRIVVMSKGVIVEEGSADEVVSTPRDPYTRLLISSSPESR